MSGGGSEYFDLVVDAFKKYRHIKNLRAIIRPGSFIAYGHGYYIERLKEINLRKKEWKPRQTKYNSGSIWKYAQTVGPAHKGAVTQPGAHSETHVYADI